LIFLSLFRSCLLDWFFIFLLFFFFSFWVSVFLIRGRRNLLGFTKFEDWFFFQRLFFFDWSRLVQVITPILSLLLLRLLLAIVSIVAVFIPVLITVIVGYLL
jgi:hypothetical protein